MNFSNDPTDEQIDDLNNKLLFVRDAMPDMWLEYAEDLEKATEALWTDNDNGMTIKAETQLNGSMSTKKSTAHSRSYILLAGLALENVFKGLLVADDPKLITSGHLHKTLKSHKLIDLAGKVKNLALTKDEKQILQICQDAIPYWGRYPIPVEYQGLKPEEIVSEEFRTCFRQLHFRLCKWLYDLLKDGWDSGVGPETLHIRSVRYGDTIDQMKKLPWRQDDDE